VQKKQMRNPVLRTVTTDERAWVFYDVSLILKDEVDTFLRRIRNK
jgi:hypothetical protein